MKIAISGAANSGKTTLATHLSKKMKLPVIEEGVAEVTAATRANLPMQTIIKKFCQAERSKRLLEQKKKRFITDRCAIDLFSGWLAVKELRNSPESVDFYNKCKKNTQKYDFVIFLQWGSINIYEEMAEIYSPVGSSSDLPWRDFTRHIPLIGLAASWLGPDKILIVPESIVNIDERVEWLINRFNLPG